MKLNKLLTPKTITLAIIFILTAFFRLYRLGSIPQGIFSDEVAVGYNAYSIIKTGRDEFGKFMPLFFRSFGEGKLPLYVYQAVPSVWLFGLTGLAVRLPMALAGSFTVLAWFLFLQETLSFSKIKKNYHFWIAAASAFSLSIMPWHIHFSRGVFGQESLFWVVLGSWLIIKGLKKDKKTVTFLGFLSLTISLLLYHSPKVILPLWAPILIYSIMNKLKKTPLWLFRQTYIGIFILMVTWGFMTFQPLGMARAKGVSVFSEYSGVSAKLHQSYVVAGQLNRPTLLTRAFHNKVESYGRDILGRYLSHFNPDLLFISGDQIRPRYYVPGQAQIFAVFIPFILIGLYFSLKHQIYLPLIFLLLAPLPAAMSFETPSTVRALFMTPPLAFLAGLGLVETLNYLKNKHLLRFLVIILTVFGLIYQLISYFDSYFYLAQVQKPYAWQYAYKPLVSKVTSLQDKYDHIVVTGNGGPPYIFFLFYQQYDPLKFQQQVGDHIGETDPFGFIHITGYDNFTFPKEDCPFDESAKNTLFVCQKDGEGIDRKYLIDTIYHQDNTPAFTLFDPEHEE